MIRNWFILAATILLALAGGCISYNLLVKHEVKSTGLSWFDSTCEAGEDEESARSCDEVMASKWGMFPPVPEGVPAEKRHQPVSVLGLFTMRPRPISLFGMFYFSAMAAWYLAIGRPNYRRRFWHLAPSALNAMGVAGAVFFTYLMFFTDLEAWCPWCLVAHVCNGLMLVGTLMLWPRKHVAPATRNAAKRPSDEPSVKGSKAAAAAQSAHSTIVGSAGFKKGKGITRPIPHPTGRLVLVALGGIIAVLASQWYYYDYAGEYRAHARLRAGYARLNHEMDKVRNHAKTLYSIYQENEKKEITVRDDDPIRNLGSNRLLAVVISDFRCPHCGGFAKYVREVVEPMFGEHLAVTFKHYPADKVCNKYMPKDRESMHPKACLASAAAEAARLLGGTEAFWRAHDLLFEAPRKELGQDAFYVQLADQLGFDRQRFVEAMKSKVVAERIVEDIDLARQIGLRGTPSLYLSGREVPSLCREQDVFWTEVKRRYDRLLKAHRQKKAREQEQQERE